MVRFGAQQYSAVRRCPTRDRLVVVAVVVVVVASTLLASSDVSTASPRAAVPVPSTQVDTTGSGILSSVSVTQGPHSTISAVVTVETTKNAVVLVTVSKHGRTVVKPPNSAHGTMHTVAVVGLRAGTTYRLAVTAKRSHRTSGTASLVWTTGSLPEDLPAPKVTTANPSAMARGVTLFNAFPRNPRPDTGVSVVQRKGFVVAVDDTGAVIWYYEAGLQIADVSQTSRGTLLLGVGDTVIREIDVLGNTVHEYATRLAYARGTDGAGHGLTTPDSTPIAIDSSHHEVAEISNGDLLTLSSQLVELTPADAEAVCPNDPETMIVADVVVELSPDGAVIQQWPLTDVLNPAQRPGTEMCSTLSLGASSYPDAPTARDWTHANAVVLDEEHNRLLVSVRHLDAVVAIRYHDDADGPAGQLLWEFGHDGTLTMTGNGTWPYHQHAIELDPNGDLILYDNGNHRPDTSADGGAGEKPYSRAVRYKINERDHTVTQLWQHRDHSADGSPIFTQYLGDADPLPNGDVLITHGGGLRSDNTAYSRVVEVDPGTQRDGQKDTIVFDLRLGDHDSGWNIYRSQRLQSLYGTGQPISG